MRTTISTIIVLAFFLFITGCMCQVPPVPVPRYACGYIPGDLRVPRTVEVGFRPLMITIVTSSSQSVFIQIPSNNIRLPSNIGIPSGFMSIGFGTPAEGESISQGCTIFYLAPPALIGTSPLGASHYIDGQIMSGALLSNISDTGFTITGLPGTHFIGAIHWKVDGVEISKN